MSDSSSSSSTPPASASAAAATGGGGGCGGGASGRTWRREASLAARRTTNPIRKIVDNLKRPEGHPKEHLPLSIGDPTIYGNLKTPEVLVRALEENLRSYRFNGYAHSAGTVEARTAVAKRSSVADFPVTADDVVITSGASGALDLAISVLLNPGENLLLPRPAFPLYQTLCESKGIAVKHFRLLPEKDWEVDLEDLERQIDDHTAAILITNPSNPCGSVYSKEHLEAIVAVAEKHCLPIIADEIYENMVFSGATFVPLASVSRHVPILSVSGIAKEFLVPGWRVGWVVVHDRDDLFRSVRTGLFSMSQLIIGSNTLIQSALPLILAPEPGSDAAAAIAAFRADLNRKLEINAEFTTARLSAIPGLRVVVPRGAMYVMVGVDAASFSDIADDVEFTTKLLTEENVIMLPGTIFGAPGYCRIVFSNPLEKLEDAYARVAEFCARHAKSA